MLLTPKSNASGEGTSYNVKNGEKFAGFKLMWYLCINFLKVVRNVAVATTNRDKESLRNASLRKLKGAKSSLTN